MGKREFNRVRKIALALPEVNERLSHGAPCFYVRDKRPLCYYHDADFAADRRLSIWCPAGPGVPEELVAADPDRFFRPTPSASGIFSDWLGIYLDTAASSADAKAVDSPIDWSEITAILQDAYRCVAPKKLIAELDRR